MLSQIQDMDLQLLRLFMTIVDSGGFAAAQGKLGVAQSTISTQMAKLEVRLGFRLCERGKSGFKLTAKGIKVYQSAGKLLDAVGAFTRETQAVSDTLIGELRIGLSELLAPQILELIGNSVGHYRARAHDVTLNIITGTPDELETMLLSGKLDIAIGYFSINHAALNYQRLFTEVQKLYCGKHHPLFTAASVTAEALNHADKVSHAYRMKSVGARFVAERQNAISERVEADLIFILSGAHISFLPEHVAKPWLDAGKVKELLPAEFGYNVDFQLTTPNRQDLSEALIVFRDHIIETFRVAGH